MWKTTFIAAGIALVAYAFYLGAQSPEIKKRAVLIAIGLGLLLWLFMAGLLGLFSGPFSARRDIGYLVGSALMILSPFLGLLVLHRVLAELNVSPEFRSLVRLAAAAAAAAAAFFLPWLFMVGAIVGCAYSGYGSCM